jgi:thiosulfate dehydrogenase [quinone] large subunit
MNKEPAVLVATLLRLLLGWFMFFAGLEKILDPSWSAKGFLLAAKTFPSFYAWFALPGNAWWIDPLNAWGIFCIGLALIFGLAVRPAAWAGALLMILYYFPHNAFPTVPHGFIVEEHIIYATAFVFIALYPPAHIFGLSKKLRSTTFGKLPLVRTLL